jgi:hypothetical protein
MMKIGTRNAGISTIGSLRYRAVVPSPATPTASSELAIPVPIRLRDRKPAASRPRSIARFRRTLSENSATVSTNPRHAS